MDSSLYCVAVVVSCISAFCLFAADGAALHGRGTLTENEERLLQEYRMEVAQQLSGVRSSPDFLRIFVPEDRVQSTFTNMVNESVQTKRKGRNLDVGGAIDFDEEISDHAMVEWVKHGASVICGEPESVLLDMYEELQLIQRVGFYVYPRCTRVRRCSGSGCCASELQECASVPGTRMNVTRPFVKITLTEIDIASGRVNRRNQFLNYTLYEDTACECRNRPSSEFVCAPIQCPERQEVSISRCECKCSRRCPAPYVQDADTCQCSCRPGDRQCLKVMRGKTELPLAQCKCVSLGCEMPQCKRHTTFSRTKCRCIETAPPTRRARIWNGAGVASGRSPNLPFWNDTATTTVTTAALTMPDSSSSSSSDDDVIEQDRNHYHPLVSVPVALDPERRFYSRLGFEDDEDETITANEVGSGSIPMD